MLSDSSEDEVFSDFKFDFAVEKAEDSTQNIGLAVENFKFSRGAKGRLITTHCNPRVLKNDLHLDLSKNE